MGQNGWMREIPYLLHEVIRPAFEPMSEERMYTLEEAFYQGYFKYGDIKELIAEIKRLRGRVHENRKRLAD